MNNITRIGLAGLAAIGLALTVAALIPRTVHASPGPRQVNPTSPRTPWSGVCTPSAATLLSKTATCSISNAPKTAELVVTTVSFLVATSGPSTPVGAYLQTITDSKTLNPWQAMLTTPPNTIAGTYTVLSSSSTMFYVDPGATITCLEIVNQHSDFGSERSSCQVFGYYVPSS